MNLSTTSSISTTNHNLSTNNNLSISNNLSTNNVSNNNLANNLTTTDGNLNLNMSAQEMRKLIASRRNVKAECKKVPMDLRQKYEIIQQM